MLSVLMTVLLTACATTKNQSNPQYEQFLNQKKVQLIQDGNAKNDSSKEHRTRSNSN